MIPNGAHRLVSDVGSQPRLLADYAPAFLQQARWFHSSARRLTALVADGTYGVLTCTPTVIVLQRGLDRGGPGAPAAARGCLRWRTDLMDDNRRGEVWVVAACFNEAAGVGGFIDAIAGQEGVARLVLVDDGSSDATPELIRQRIDGSGLPISLIELTRNFGKEAAMLAGLDHARGRCGAVILIDSDLQHPPALIAAMILCWRQGAEMVTAIRDDRDQESRFRIASASGFYSVFNRLVDSIQLTDGAGDFRLLDGAVVEALTRMRESGRFSKGLYPWTGYRSVDLAYQRPPRPSGQSSWDLRRLWIYALDGIFSFSLVPLRVWTGLGVLISLISLLYAAVRVVLTLLHGIDVPGYASIIVAILLLGGIQLIGIGILGEYIGRIYVETKRRPLYFIRSVTGEALAEPSAARAAYSRARQHEA